MTKARTHVVNISRGVPYEVFIGRGSPFGNPFEIGRHGTREEVVERYKQWIQTRPDLLAQIPALRGRVLGCFCSPELCHGSVLAEIADAGEAE